ARRMSRAVAVGSWCARPATCPSCAGTHRGGRGIAAAPRWTRRTVSPGVRHSARARDRAAANLRSIEQRAAEDLVHRRRHSPPVDATDEVAEDEAERASMLAGTRSWLPHGGEGGDAVAGAIPVEQLPHGAPQSKLRNAGCVVQELADDLAFAVGANSWPMIG